ncbi:hypothetical protein B0H14DRAFT_2646499 [Mycena olivaceomarginata]|nr:hypothetical protein B0H14DRAFT_2646499 [Mycena olivaceomarginata]
MLTLLANKSVSKKGGEIAVGTSAYRTVRVDRRSKQALQNSTAPVIAQEPKIAGVEKQADDNDSTTAHGAILCFRCGRRGHGGPACREATPSGQRPEFISFRNGGGLFQILDGRPVCMMFNCGHFLGHLHAAAVPTFNIFLCKSQVAFQAINHLKAQAHAPQVGRRAPQDFKAQVLCSSYRAQAPQSDSCASRF